MEERNGSSGNESKNNTIKSYHDLIVWQKSMAFVKEIYETTSSFPKEELFGLVSQMRRSAISIPRNIAEGYGRRSKGDYLHFLRVAMGSLFELQTQLRISFNLHYLNQDKIVSSYESSREVERILTALLNKLNRN